MVFYRAQDCLVLLLSTLLFCCGAHPKDQTYTSEHIEDPYLLKKNMKTIIIELRHALQALYDNLVSQKSAWDLKQERKTNVTIPYTTMEEPHLSQPKTGSPARSLSRPVQSSETEASRAIFAQKNISSENAMLPATISRELLSWIRSFALQSTSLHTDTSTIKSESSSRPRKGKKTVSTEKDKKLSSLKIVRSSTLRRKSISNRKGLSSWKLSTPSAPRRKVHSNRKSCHWSFRGRDCCEFVKHRMRWHCGRRNLWVFNMGKRHRESGYHHQRQKRALSAVRGVNNMGENVEITMSTRSYGHPEEIRMFVTNTQENENGLSNKTSKYFLINKLQQMFPYINVRHAMKEAPRKRRLPTQRTDDIPPENEFQLFNTSDDSSVLRKLERMFPYVKLKSQENYDAGRFDGPRTKTTVPLLQFDQLLQDLYNTMGPPRGPKESKYVENIDSPLQWNETPDVEISGTEQPQEPQEAPRGQDIEPQSDINVDSPLHWNEQPDVEITWVQKPQKSPEAPEEQKIEPKSDINNDSPRHWNEKPDFEISWTEKPQKPPGAPRGQNYDENIDYPLQWNEKLDAEIAMTRQPQKPPGQWNSKTDVDISWTHLPKEPPGAPRGQKIEPKYDANIDSPGQWNAKTDVEISLTHPPKEPQGAPRGQKIEPEYDANVDSPGQWNAKTDVEISLTHPPKEPPGAPRGQKIEPEYDANVDSPGQWNAKTDVEISLTHPPKEPPAMELASDELKKVKIVSLQ
ncbi:uncharacterized protein LOC144773802 [Lissotriton helveticus]